MQNVAAIQTNAAQLGEGNAKPTRLNLVKAMQILLMSLGVFT
jgi:hypothetical protein